MLKMGNWRVIRSTSDGREFNEDLTQSITQSRAVSIVTSISTPRLNDAMAPIRRYLRITKYSVLECRIYLEYPHASETWLLGSNDPALPRVIEAIRPLVLPKLREENERASKGKGRNKKNIKDVVVRGIIFTAQKHDIEQAG